LHCQRHRNINTDRLTLQSFCPRFTSHWTGFPEKKLTQITGASVLQAGWLFCCSINRVDQSTEENQRQSGENNEQQQQQHLAATVCIHHRHLLFRSPRADTHFTVSRRVEG